MPASASGMVAVLDRERRGDAVPRQPLHQPRRQAEGGELVVRSNGPQVDRLVPLGLGERRTLPPLVLLVVAAGTAPASLRSNFGRSARSNCGRSLRSNLGRSARSYCGRSLRSNFGRSVAVVRGRSARWSAGGRRTASAHRGRCGCGRRTADGRRGCNGPAGSRARRGSPSPGDGRCRDRLPVRAPRSEYCDGPPRRSPRAASLRTSPVGVVAGVRGHPLAVRLGLELLVPRLLDPSVGLLAGGRLIVLVVLGHANSLSTSRTNGRIATARERRSRT